MGSLILYLQLRRVTERVLLSFSGDDLESGPREKGAARGRRDDGVSQNKSSAPRKGEQVLLRPRQRVPPPEYGRGRARAPAWYWSDRISIRSVDVRLNFFLHLELTISHSLN